MCSWLCQACKSTWWSSILAIALRQDYFHFAIELSEALRSQAACLSHGTDMGVELD